MKFRLLKDKRIKQFEEDGDYNSEEATINCYECIDNFNNNINITSSISLIYEDIHNPESITINSSH